MEEVTQVEAGEESRDFSWSGQRARWKILSEGQWEPCMRVLGKEWPDEICGFKKLLQLYCGKGKDVGHQGKWGQELRLGPGGACTDRVGFKSLWLNVIILVREDDNTGSRTRWMRRPFSEMWKLWGGGSGKKKIRLLIWSKLRFSSHETTLFPTPLPPHLQWSFYWWFLKNSWGHKY